MTESLHPAGADRRLCLRAMGTLFAAIAAGCGGGGAAPAAPPPPLPSPPPSPPPPPPAMPTSLRVTALTGALASPWGMALLPDNRWLITQRGGAMVIVSADGQAVSPPLTGVPPVVAQGQGGLLDVVLDPDFASDPWVYWSFSEAGNSGGSGTAVARGRLVGNRLADVAVIFRQLPKVGGDGHFGCRLVFRGDKTLFVTLGERQLGTPAQDLAGHLGKVVRIHRDGSVPGDNPAFGAGARPELWSIGHRNPQGAALHPTTGELWLVEHGPQGGDELNRVTAGSNFGWPVKSYGCNYGAPIGDSCRIGAGTHAPTYIEPVSIWVPTSTAPAGMAFYRGDRLPDWRGNLLVGALAGTTLWRLVLDGERVIQREEVAAVKVLGERIRCVANSPDGWLVMLTDSGKLLRLEAA